MYIGIIIIYNQETYIHLFFFVILKYFFVTFAAQLSKCKIFWETW